MRAMRPHRHQSPEKGRAGRKSDTIEIRSSQRATFPEWLLIDELALGLEVARVRFPGDGSHQHELLDPERTPGVRHIIDTAHTRDVYAVLLFQGPRGRRELRARLEELAEAFFWNDALPGVSVTCDRNRGSALRRNQPHRMSSLTRLESLTVRGYQPCAGQHGGNMDSRVAPKLGQQEQLHTAACVSGNIGPPGLILFSQGRRFESSRPIPQLRRRGATSDRPAPRTPTLRRETAALRSTCRSRLARLGRKPLAARDSS